MTDERCERERGGDGITSKIEHAKLIFPMWKGQSGIEWALEEWRVRKYTGKQDRETRGGEEERREKG